MAFMNEAIIICDFDGTITKTDSINDFLGRFADKKWLEIEEDWINGTIPTTEAMRMQFNLIKNMTEEKMNEFFDSVEIDEFFLIFYEKAKKENVKVVIISDGFEYFIKRILSKYGIDDIEIYSNHFEFKDGEFYMSFPNKNPYCKRGAGTCKCKLIEKHKKIYNKVYYVGDGVSDFCPANKVDFLFAKNKLSEYCKRNNIPYMEYSNFNEVINNDRIKYRFANR